MRNVDECMHKVSRVPGFTFNDFFHVAEFVNVQNEANGVAAKENHNDAQKHQTQVNFFALSPSRAEPKTELKFKQRPTLVLFDTFLIAYL